MAKYDGYRPSGGVTPAQPSAEGLRPVIGTPDRQKAEAPAPTPPPVPEHLAPLPENAAKPTTARRIVAVINFAHRGDALPLDVLRSLKDPKELRGAVNRAQVFLGGFELSQEERDAAAERLSGLPRMVAGLSLSGQVEAAEKQPPAGGGEDTPHA